MLANAAAFSSFSTNDVERAKQFYESVLGLLAIEEMGGLGFTLAGGMNLFIYPKEDHVPASHTVLNFQVPDVAAAVAGLKQRGVAFEHYTGAMATDADGVYRGGGPLIAWFKDPAGNTLSVIQEN